MPYISSSEVLTEAAGVTIVTSSPEESASEFAPGKIILQMEKVNGSSDNSLGFHLTKSKWDPFPWIGYVENGSPADLAGMRAGDCLLSVDGVDLLGLRVVDVATLIRKENGGNHVNIAVWRYPFEEETQDDIGLALKGPLPHVTKNLMCALSGMIRFLECPICLETSTPPISQCVHGHILCVVCRPKMTRCPVCRVRLGQGRCLLADNLHRVLRDTYLDANCNRMGPSEIVQDASDRRSLYDQLFGKTKRREEPLAATRRNKRGSLKPKQFLLAKLLMGNRDKAASADNLTTRVPEIEEGAISAPVRAAAATDLLRLSLNDRVKSASTGELSRDQLQTPFTSSSSQIAGSNRELCVRHTVSQQSLSSQQPLVLSGSTESVSCAPLACPLLRLCNEVVTLHSLAEHIKSHQVPQVHFYSRNASIPLPVPFGPEAFYIFHHDGYMFFFQIGSNSAWMTCPTMACANNATEWTLHAWDENGSEIYLRRYVACLEDPVTLTSQHIAPLPNLLPLKTLNIHIADQRADDRFYV